MTHNYKRTLLSTLVLGALYNSAAAEVKTDGSVGQQVDIQAPDKVYEITSDLGQTRGNNLFHSFEQFNVETGYTANFSGPANIQNIISRVTGAGASHIDGTLQSSIQGANLFLLNPNGVLFGANASLNISGSFYTSTADYVKLGDQDYFYADPAKQSSFVSAEPSAFGFLSNTPNKIEVSGSQLSVAEGQTLSLVGGDITLDGAQLNAVNGTVNIASVASSGEVAGSVQDMDATQFSDLGDISLSNGAKIDTSGSSGGRIVIRGGNLAMDNSSIAANTTGDLNANIAEGIDIALTKDLVVDNDSHISTNLVAGASAHASGITVTAANAMLNNNSSMESLTQKQSTGTSGNVALVIEDNLRLTNQSRISTQTAGSGDSGDITITSKSLDLETASYISTSAILFPFTSNSAGDIHINSDKINIDGLTKSRFSIFDQNLDFTGISANAGFRGGVAGSIDIETRELKMVNNASIESGFYGEENESNITISANNGPVTLLNGATISTSSHNIGGKGNPKCGDITIIAGDVLISGVNIDDARVTGVFTNADASSSGGDISISAKSIHLENGARISAQDEFDNDLKLKSGSVSLSADRIIISGVNREFESYLLSLGATADQAFRESSSNVSIYNDGNNYSNPQFIPGNITINAKNFYLTDYAMLRSENFGRPTPGDITVNATNKAVFDNSLVTSASGDGIGVGGDINVTSSIAVFSDSTLETTAIEGRGGNINISAKAILATPGSVFNASSQFSVDGNISFNSNVDIEKSVAALPSSAEDVTGKFTQDCTVHPDRYSRFKTAASYTSVNAANSILFSNYTIKNYDNNSVAASQFANPYNGVSLNNLYEFESLFLAQVDCSTL